jgi:hypothetical protein
VSIEVGEFIVLTLLSLGPHLPGPRVVRAAVGLPGLGERTCDPAYKTGCDGE